MRNYYGLRIFFIYPSYAPYIFYHVNWLLRELDNFVIHVKSRIAFKKHDFFTSIPNYLLLNFYVPFFIIINV